MSFIADYYLKYLYKLKVVHSLPGRMRISVPGLKGLAAEYRVYQDEVKGLLQELPGVDEVDFSYSSGNSLITYDPQVVSEKQILAWLEGSVKAMVALGKELDNGPKRSDEEVVKIASERLRSMFDRFREQKNVS